MIQDLNVFAGFTKLDELPTYAKFIKAVVDWMQSSEVEDMPCDVRIKSLNLEGRWDWDNLSALRRYKDHKDFRSSLTPHSRLGSRCLVPHVSRLSSSGDEMISLGCFESWVSRLMFSYASVAYAEDATIHAKGLNKGKNDELYLFHYFHVEHDDADKMNISSAGFKLGRSIDAQSRLKSLKTGAACLVVPLVVIKRAGDLEPLIHAAMKSVSLRDNDEFYRPGDLMLLLSLIGVAIEIIDRRPASEVIEGKLLNLKYAPLARDDERYDHAQDYYSSYSLQGGLVLNRDMLKYDQVSLWHEDNPFNILWPRATLPNEDDENWGEMSLSHWRYQFVFFATMPLVTLNLFLCMVREVKRELHRKYGSILKDWRYCEHFMICNESIYESIPYCLLNSELEGADMTAIYDMFQWRYDKD